MKKLILISILLFKGILLFSQSDSLFSLLVKDFLTKCYSETKITPNFNYLVVRGEDYPNSHNQFLYLSLKPNYKKRESEISKYLKSDFSRINLNINEILPKLLKSKNFDTTSNSLNKLHCKGGIIINGLLKEISSSNTFYLLITKFNSKHTNRQIELIVKYKLINNKWKYISEEMISII